MQDQEIVPPVPQDPPEPDAPFSLTFRAVKPDDLHFVLNAWMRSYRDAKRTMKNATYFAGQQRLIAALASRRNMVIGCDADAPDWIAGFACGCVLDDGRLLLDYIYVKQPYRMRNIAKALAGALGWHPGMPVVSTHWNKVCNILSQRFLIEHDEYFNILEAE